MLKIIHGADFHLDSPFSGLSPERAAQRRGEQRELLDRLAGLVIGALKWLLLMSILLNLAQLADIGLPVYGSRIVTATADLAPWLFGYAAGII